MGVVPEEDTFLGTKAEGKACIVRRKVEMMPMITLVSSLVCMG